MKRNSKRIGIDIAGFGLVLLAPLLGWLPGPGGIPLLLAGLGLLSINHAWARRLRDKLIASGNKVATFLFPNNKIIQLLYDLFALFLLVTIVLMLNENQEYITVAISGIVGFAAFCILVINRQRGSRIKSRTYDKIRKA